MRLRLLWPGAMFIAACLSLVGGSIHASRGSRPLATETLFATGLPFCPPGGTAKLKASDATGHHRVALTWKASPPVKDSPVGYCIYRSKTKGAAKKDATCKDCEQVNSVPLMNTDCVDDFVEDGAEYYYVVTAITNTGDASSSSNEIRAPIPANRQSVSPGATTSSPFCRGAAATSP